MLEITNHHSWQEAHRLFKMTWNLKFKSSKQSCHKPSRSEIIFYFWALMAENTELPSWTQNKCSSMWSRCVSSCRSEDGYVNVTYIVVHVRCMRMQRPCCCLCLTPTWGPSALWEWGWQSAAICCRVTAMFYLWRERVRETEDGGETKQQKSAFFIWKSNLLMRKLCSK